MNAKDPSKMSKNELRNEIIERRAETAKPDLEIKFLKIERDNPYLAIFMLRDENERLKADCQGYYNEASEGWTKFRNAEKRIEQLEGALAESCDENRSHVLSEGPWSTDMCPIAGKLSARVAELEGALFGSNGALTRMDRARKILNDRHGFDKQQIMFLAWNVLNTDDIKAALKGDT